MTIDRDLKSLDANYLIDNIDRSYDAWKKHLGMDKFLLIPIVNISFHIVLIRRDYQLSVGGILCLAGIIL